MKRRFAALAAPLVALTTTSLAQLAQDPPGFAFPFNTATYRMTAAFDLDRAADTRADYTGWRSGDPTAGSGHAYDGHSGSDFGMPNGTPLYAIANGTVTARYQDFPTNDTSGGGNYIITSHAAGGHTYRVNFWHLDYQGALVGVGSSVTKGQQIAISNNTGNSTGPHLHYGISRSSATNNYTCPFYHGWWEAQEYYWGDTRPCLIFVRVNSGPLNCRTGNTTAYPVVATLPAGGVFVATQHNGWYRILLPMPPAWVVEARTPTGALSTAYSETGSWLNDAGRSTVADLDDSANRTVRAAAGSRYSTFSGTGGTQTATFRFTPPQRGTYRVLATWPRDANALGVGYSVTHLNGTSTVTLDQRGDASPVGAGTHASPFVIARNPYVGRHSTVGAESIWPSYSPAGSGISQGGPERLYRLLLPRASTVRVRVDHADYPTKDVDIHLLGSQSNSNCLARADWSFSHSAGAGTYFIAADTYQNPSRATDYTLTVELDDTTPMPDSWVLVGEYAFDRAVEYTVQVRQQGVTGPADPSRPGRVYADAIKIVPVITHRSVFISSDASLSSRVNTATTPVCSVVVHADSLAGNDSRDIADYIEVPVHASKGTGATNSSPIVAKAVTGHRFVVTERTPDGWYRVHLTNATGATSGWVSGRNLTIYNAGAATLVPAAAPEGWVVR
jgi:murein DD-endopeptidase MepM/ murein hydrolase activator NlpD